MKKQATFLTLFFSAMFIALQGQYYYYGMPHVHMRMGARKPQPARKTPAKPPFKPTLNLSAGYGFPNLDKNQLALFYNFYTGSVRQNGPFTGAIDYHFSRSMSIGVMGTFGKVSAPYYDYNSSGIAPSFTGSLESWSVMLNIMNYIPTYSHKVEPYLRTAMGVNTWKQNYLDPDGNKAVIVSDPSSFAYQVSFGSRFNLSKQACLFLEAGYGKYILSGGLTLKF